jgi:hypothetical protein
VHPQRAAFQCNTGAQEKRKKDLSRDLARLSQLPDQVDRVHTTRVVGRRAGSKGGKRRSNDAGHASFWQDARHGIPNADGGRTTRSRGACTVARSSALEALGERDPGRRVPAAAVRVDGQHGASVGERRGG